MNNILDNNNLLFLHERLKLIKLNNNTKFSEALFIFEDFIKYNYINRDYIPKLLDFYSGKIILLDEYKNYDQSNLFMLLYVSALLYDDLSNPYIKKKMKMKDFIKITNGLNNNSNFPIELIKEIYNDIYDNTQNNNTQNQKKIKCTIS